MLGWFLFGVSAYAAYLWAHWFAIGNAVLNLATLGIIQAYAKENGVNAMPSSRAEHVAITMNAATSIVGLGLFLARFGSK